MGAASQPRAGPTREVGCPTAQAHPSQVGPVQRGPWQTFWGGHITLAYMGPMYAPDEAGLAARFRAIIDTWRRSHAEDRPADAMRLRHMRVLDDEPAAAQQPPGGGPDQGRPRRNGPGGEVRELARTGPEVAGNLIRAG